MYSYGISKMPERKLVIQMRINKQESIKNADSLKVHFLLKALEIKDNAKRVEFLRNGGYVSGTYHSAEPLSDGTTHETIDEGFQNADILSRNYEFISFEEVKNYENNEINEWLIYKTRNSTFIFELKDQMKELQMPEDHRGRFSHKNITISFAVDRYAYVEGKSYLIKSIILRESK